MTTRDLAMPESQRPLSTMGRRWALIIGIDDYRYAPHLRCARNDARLLGMALTDVCNFLPDDVFLMMDKQGALATDPRYPSAVNIRHQLMHHANSIQAEDFLFVAFIGHGHSDDGTGFLVPVDGNMADPGSLIPMSWVVSTLASSRARQRLLYIDACHAGARSADPGASPAEALLGSVGGSAMLTMASCNSRQLSQEDVEIGHGWFTAAIVEGLRGKAAATEDGVITPHAVMEYAHVRLMQRAREGGLTQTPVLRGESEGRLVLARILSRQDLLNRRQALRGSLGEIEGKSRSPDAIESIRAEIVRLESELAQRNAQSEGYANADAVWKRLEELNDARKDALNKYLETSAVIRRIDEERREIALPLLQVYRRSIISLESEAVALAAELKPKDPLLLQAKSQIRTVSDRIDKLESYCALLAQPDSRFEGNGGIFSADSRQVFGISPHGETFALNLEDGRISRGPSLNAYRFEGGFSVQDGESGYVLFWSERSIWKWYPGGRNVRRIINAKYDYKISSVAPGGRRFLDSDERIRLRILGLFTVKWQLKNRPLISSDDRHVLLQGDDGICICDFKSWNTVFRLLASEPYITSFCLSKDQRSIGIVRDHRIIEIYDMASGKLVSSRDRGHKGFYSINMSPDGRNIALIIGEEAQVWRVEGMLPLLRTGITGTGRLSKNAQFSPDGSKLLVSNYGNVSIYRV